MIVAGKISPETGGRILLSYIARRDTFFRIARWMVPVLVGVGATVAAAVMVPTIERSSSREDYVVKVEAVAW